MAINKALNRPGVRRGSIEKVVLNIFGPTIYIKGCEVVQKDKDLSVTAKVPSIVISSRIIPLLRGEIVPKSISFSKPEVVLDNSPNPPLAYVERAESPQHSPPPGSAIPEYCSNSKMQNASFSVPLIPPQSPLNKGGRGDLHCLAEAHLIAAFFWKPYTGGRSRGGHSSLPLCMGELEGVVPEQLGVHEFTPPAKAGLDPGFITSLLFQKSKSRTRKAFLNLRVEAVVIENGRLTFRDSQSRRGPFYYEIQRIDVRVEDILFDENAEPRSLELRSLTACWPGETEAGLSYSGSYGKKGALDSYRLAGEIRRFPLTILSEAVEKEYKARIRSGYADLASEILVEGTVLESTHNLTLSKLDVSLEKNVGDVLSVDVAGLVLQVLKLASGGDEYVIENVRLKADLKDDPGSVLEELAGSALEQVLSRLANQLLQEMREGKEDIKEKIKEIGQSLLEVFE